MFDDLHVQSCASQQVGSTTGFRIRVEAADDDSPDPGFENGLGTRWGSSLVGAGFKGRVERSVAKPMSTGFDEQPLGMWTAHDPVMAFTNDVAFGVHAHAPNHGVGFDVPVSTQSSAGSAVQQQCIDFHCGLSDRHASGPGPYETTPHRTRTWGHALAKRGALGERDWVGEGIVANQVLARTSSVRFGGMIRYSLGSMELDARPWLMPRRIVV